MGRMYVASTPASRGEADQELYEQTLTVDALRKAAEEAGFELVPVDPEEKPDEEPGGNASREEWAAYARTRGATDDDLKDLKRDDIRDKYQSPQD